METLINSITANILEIILAVISIIVSYYIIPAIKEDLIPWLKEKRIYGTVKKFVQAAEKMANSGLIPKCDKKKEVIALLYESGIEIDETVEAFIESACKELDIALNTIYEEIVEEDEDKTE